MLHCPHFREAQMLLLSRAETVDAENIPLSEACGRILAQDVIAEDHIPPFDRSPFDGYAFRSADTTEASREHPVTLKVLENIPAGSVPTKTITAGTAVRLMTGAPIPQGADAVCKYEDTIFTPESVKLFRPSKPGSNIVRAGEDVAKGTILAKAGNPIDTGLAGVLSSQGIALPRVYRTIKVGIISTGNEVIETQEALLPGKIRNSNRHTLECAVLSMGMKPVYLGLALDDAEEITALIEKGLIECDVLLLTGGASVGDYDLTPTAMEAAGVELVIRGADLKPGMACAYGWKGKKLVCCLSGNPASALTNFYCIAAVALKKIAGWVEPVPPEITVTLANGFGKKSPGTRILRGKLDLSDGTVRMVVPQEQGNVVLSSNIGNNVMAIVPAGTGPLETGMVLKGFLL